MGDANNLEHNLKRTEPNQQIQCTSAVYHALHLRHQQHGVKLCRSRVKRIASRSRFEDKRQYCEGNELRGFRCRGRR